MSYSPATWKNGDTITADGMNNIERGVADIDSGYTPTVWQTGDIITAEKLNTIEQGIADAAGSAITVESLSVTANGTYTAPEGKAYSPVDVSVSNSYSAGDEGKVVKNGALASQGSATYTTNNTYNTTDISSVTVNVSGGGTTEAEEKDVNFYDYDGTCLYSYNAADFANLDALPANPSHDGLTAQGWNWTLADAKTYVASYGFLDIGQMYTTSDGKTKLYIHIESGTGSDYLKFTVRCTPSVSTGVIIAWGDGDSTTTDSTSAKNYQHTYATAGDYVVSIEATSGTVAFAGTSAANGYAIYGSKGGYIQRSRIRAVEFGNNVSSIGIHAFSMCVNLETVAISKNITSFDGGAFIDCARLKFLTIPSGTTTIPNSMAKNGYSIKRISIPKSATTIGSEFILYNTNVKRVCIPAECTAIGNNALSYLYALESIVIPASVTSIGNSVFSNCWGLAEIHFLATTPPTLGTTSFSVTNCVIYVPYSADHSVLAAYQAETNWSDISSRIFEEAV